MMCLRQMPISVLTPDMILGLRPRRNTGLMNIRIFKMFKLFFFHFLIFYKYLWKASLSQISSTEIRALYVVSST